MRRVSFIAACLAAIAACALGTRSFADCRLRVMAEFPVTMVGNQAVVVAQINGADVPVVLDSGATFDLLSYAAAAKLHLARQSPSGHPFIQGVGGARGSGRLFALAVANVRLGGARISGAKFIVSDLRLGDPVAGFIGRDILDDYDIDYDLPRREIKLVRTSGCRNVAPVYWARSRPYESSDVARFGSSPTVVGHVDGVEVRVMFDTGASSTILDVRAAAKAGVTPSSAGAVAGDAIRGVGGGSKNTWVVPIAKVVIAGEEIRNTRLRIGDLSLPQVDMVLGSDFFLSHHVFFANSQQRVYFTYEGGSVFNRAP